MAEGKEEPGSGATGVSGWATSWPTPRTVTERQVCEAMDFSVERDAPLGLGAGVGRKAEKGLEAGAAPADSEACEVRERVPEGGQFPVQQYGAPVRAANQVPRLEVVVEQPGLDAGGEGFDGGVEGCASVASWGRRWCMR